MPELPEVETIKMQLESRIVGRRILGVQVKLPKIFEGDPKAVIGATITGVERRAKILLLKLDNDLVIAFHLKMSGQVLLNGQVGKYTHAVFELDDNIKLIFNDVRQFGWIRVVDNQQLTIMNNKHGPEPFDFAQGKPSEFTPEYLFEICQKWGRPVKLLLMDQAKIAGIGNIYANEALWCAGISPMKRARELDRERVGKLHECILEVLKMGIKYQGSSAKDETYIDALGEKGTAQEHFVVYQKQGTKCPRCGGTITMSRIGGRGTFFCPKCQK